MDPIKHRQAHIYIDSPDVDDVLLEAYYMLSKQNTFKQLYIKFS